MDSSSKRKNTRFKPDPGATAQLCFAPLEKEFKADLNALVLTESYGGCSLVLVNSKQMVQGSRLRVKIGELAPLSAEVRWVEIVENDIQKIGLQYTQ